MRTRSPREALWQALSTIVLVVFPLVACGFAVLLAVVSFQHPTDWVRTACRVLFVGFAPALVWAFVQAVRYRPEPDEGLELTPEDHPRLWQQLNQVATTLGTEPPGRVLLTAEANAAVRQVNSGSGAQIQLQLGLPLLVTYTVDELRATLGHEFGHVLGGDVAATARLARAGLFLDSLRRRSPLWTRWLVTAYAMVFALLDAAASRAAEGRADEAALAVAPAPAAASAMRQDVAASLTWWPPGSI